MFVSTDILTRLSIECLSGVVGRFIKNALKGITLTKVLYMSSSFWLLGFESRDFSHAEKERTACKDEQIQKMTTIFTQNGPRLSF